MYMGPIDEALKIGENTNSALLSLIKVDIQNFILLMAISRREFREPIMKFVE